MKFDSILAFVAILPSGVWAGHLPECSDFNVTDVESCEAWCGGEGYGHMEVVAGHADTTEGLHVGVLEGMECHCEHGGMMHDMNVTVDSNATEVPTNGTVVPTNATATEEPTEGSATEAPTNATEATGRRQLEGEEDDDHKACWLGHTPFPTCAEKGLGECEEGAEMTCADLCASIPGVVGADVEHRFLDEVHGEHVCKRTEGVAMHDSSHGDDHDSHDEYYPDYTMCLCNAAESGGGLMVCADDGWRCAKEGGCDGEHDGADASLEASGANAIRMVAPAALAFLVALI